MKRTLKLSLWGALIVFANHLSATGMESFLDVNMVGSKAFELTIDDLKGDLKISLLSEGNGVLYKEQFTNTGSLKKIFDLGLFPNGSYSIQLVDSEKKISLPILIEDNNLSINALKKSVHFLPVVNKKDNKVSVNMAAFEEDYLDISILNSTNEVIYETRLREKNSMGKIFDFSHTYRGMYQFLLISKAGLFSKQIMID